MRFSLNPLRWSGSLLFAVVIGTVVAVIGTLVNFDVIPLATTLPPRDASMRPLFIAASVLAIACPLLCLAVFQEIVAIRQVMFSFLLCMVSQILLEAVAYNIFFPSLVLFVALPFIAFRIIQATMGFKHIGREPIDKKLKLTIQVVLATNFVFWIGVGGQLLLFRFPKLF